jgi:hypothetical protein
MYWIELINLIYMSLVFLAPFILLILFLLLCRRMAEKHWARQSEKSLLATRQKLMAECNAFNKGLSPRLRKSYEEYVAYKYGIVTPEPDLRWISIPKEEVVYRREEQHVPSLNSGVLCPAEKTEKVYTGEVVTGIATMHKSNQIPVINKQQAKDLASMRR